MKTLMQSGAGMLLSHAAPSMSYSAQRIVRLAAHLRMFMQHPEATPWFEQHVFEVETALRAYALEYIELACLDLNAQAELSKLIAAGRAVGGQAKRPPTPRAAVVSHFSTAFAKGGFCQAGVVAPPDSLMDEKTPCAESGASR